VIGISVQGPQQTLRPVRQPSRHFGNIMNNIRSQTAEIVRDSNRVHRVSTPGSFRLWLSGLLVTTLISSISIAWIDKPTALLIRNIFGPQHFRDQVVGSPVFSTPLIAMLMLVAFAVISIVRKKFSKLAISIPLCGLSVLAADVITIGLKLAFGRAWPDSWDPNIHSLIQDNVYGFNFFYNGITYGSFPSGHAAAVASASAILWRLFPGLTRMWAICIIAADLGLVLLNLHFVSDVVAGTFIGLSTGLFTASFVRTLP
jgi:membrane-associated phospholipid phosphatase